MKYLIAPMLALSLVRPAVGDDFAEILNLAGWDDATFEQLVSCEPLSPQETDQALKLLHRLKSFDSFSLHRWTNTDLDLADVIDEPGARELIRVSGTLVSLEEIPLPEADALRLEMPAYYRCHVELGDSGLLATVIVAAVPNAFRQETEVYEPVSFTGLFLKQTSCEPGAVELAFVAPRLGWHPHKIGGANHSLSWAILGNLGFDVGLLDEIHNPGRIRPQEREAFYQLLNCVEDISVRQLIRAAERCLPEFAEQYPARSGEAGQQALLAQEVQQRFEEGEFSVAPLFLDADKLLGQLVVLEGIVRRAVRVEVGMTPDGQPSDVLQRFGIDHYYELDLFTEDSQNYPVVFCVRELPEGFPTGSKLHEPVQIAGFFFKSWLHRAREAAETDTSESRLQAVPLLIGRAPIVLETEARSPSHLVSLLGGSAFVLAILGIWAMTWWYARGDRAFYKKSIASQFELPGDQTLAELAEVDTTDSPDFTDWEQR